jgi:uncharacterized membrane protein
VDRARLEAFSDGVLAVAITLLVLDLPNAVPGRGSLADQWASDWPSFLAYLVSFLVIGVIWLNHHAVFKDIGRVDRPIQVMNLLLLLFATTIPFSTRSLSTFLLAGASDARLAGAVYGLVIEGVALTFGAICAWSWRAQLFQAHVSAAHARRAVAKFGIGSLVILGAIGAALVDPPLALAIHGGIAIFYTLDQPPGRTTNSH